MQSQRKTKKPRTMLAHRSRGTLNKAHTVYHGFCFSARKDSTMKKFSLVETAKMIANNSGDESDMIFIVRSNGDCFTTGCVGMNKSFSSYEAVKLAGFLRDFLEEKLAFALDIFDELSEAGCIGFTSKNKEQAVLNYDEAKTGIDKLLERLVAVMEDDKNADEH